ncbi:ABATE domain-containing protein [Streptomyces sp. NPDC056352]|uniref:ABATE domain-containing protein n=1 Tax=Streptomyces sp. NPDC056352 TaxID=3345791 RepID=UPI0035DE3C7B
MEARRPPAPIERIGSPGPLDSWFVESGLFDKKAGSDEADLRAALEPREVIYLLADGPLQSASWSSRNTTFVWTAMMRSSFSSVTSEISAAATTPRC